MPKNDRSGILAEGLFDQVGAVQITGSLTGDDHYSLMRMRSAECGESIGIFTHAFRVSAFRVPHLSL